ncbi:MAG: hypothetical protein SNH27_10085 [Rikenellaceae bacterium]
MVNSKQHILSPKILKKGEDQSYIAVEELADTLTHKECQNIALTGPFGSGKSSILRTLCKEYSNKPKDNSTERHSYNFLNVSLAALCCEEENDSAQGNIKPTTNFEYSLLQQLFYTADPNVVSQSRFKRIKNLSVDDTECIASKTVFLIIAIIILFEPATLRIESFYEVYSKLGIWWGKLLNIIGDILATIYILYCIYHCAFSLIKHLFNAKVTKLGAKDGVVEVHGTASAFNQHLEEIIYFFEATSYDVVIFEDIDRFDKPEVIFNKLREVNLLINNSHFCHRDKRTIRFIYAVRDDIFEGELRTKFFDYIVSSAPIINLGNAKNYLRDHLEKAGITDVDEHDLMSIGAFIGSMRELKNIVNEFRQHKEMFGTIPKPQNLLAMIVYKNKYPKDYAGLHNNSGVLYRALRLKSQYANPIVEQNDKNLNSTCKCN